MNDILEHKVKESNLSAYEKIIEYQKNMPYVPFDIDAFCAEVEHITLVRKVLGDAISGVIIKEDENRFSIYVNDSQSEVRQRFTAAHEIAHFLLHKDQLGDKFPENMLFRGGLSNQEETEANKLAAEILMPDAAIDEYIKNNNGRFTIRNLAQAFNVSPSAMAVRLGIPLD